MVVSKELQELVERAKKLTPEEQNYLLSQLKPQAQVDTGKKRGFDIESFAGIAPYPLLGEDAQQWISRERQADSEHRDAQLRRNRED